MRLLSHNNLADKRDARPNGCDGQSPLDFVHRQEGGEQYENYIVGRLVKVRSVKVIARSAIRERHLSFEGEPVMRSKKHEIPICCLLAFVLTLSPTTQVLGDTCDNEHCADIGATCAECCPGGTGSDHESHGGYTCEYSTSDSDCEDWDTLVAAQTPDHVFDLGPERNCSCTSYTWSITESETKTTTNTANLSGSIGGSLTATAGVSVAGLAKAEASATASWTAGVGWGNSDSASKTLSVTANPSVPQCYDGYYYKYYHYATVEASETLTFSWSCGSCCCCVPSCTCYQYGSEDHEEAVTGEAFGYKQCAHGGHYSNGMGFQPQMIPDICTDCMPTTPCYLGTDDDCDEQCPCS